MTRPSPFTPGRWARIHRIELAASERAPTVPDDTAAVPFEAWINGWLEAAGPVELGARVALRTPAGRIVEGELVELDPGYHHTFGTPPQPLQRAAVRARSIVFPEPSE